MPGITLTEDSMNKTIQIYIPPELNSFKIGDPISLVLENYSNELVVLPQDYGIHIFQHVDGEWELVENKMEYSSSKKLVNPNKDHNQLVFVTIFPNIFAEQKVSVRVVIEGYSSALEGEKPETKIGSYIDVTLNSK